MKVLTANRDRRFKRPMEAGNVVGGRVRWDTERGLGESGCLNRAGIIGDCFV